MKPADLETRLAALLRERQAILRDLELVRDLGLPQCYVGAGYVRSYVWDRLHGYEARDVHQDIDVVFYDPDDTDEEREVILEEELIRLTGNPKWSVKNQARMHAKNGFAPYTSTWDALSYWPERVTAVGVRLDAGGRLEIIAPYGLEDLFDMVVRRSPKFPDREYYLNRLQEKGWKRHWPLITVLED